MTRALTRVEFWVLSVAGLCLFFGVWAIASLTHAASEQFLPAPWTVLAKFVDLTRHPFVGYTLQQHLAVRHPQRTHAAVMHEALEAEHALVKVTRAVQIGNVERRLEHGAHPGDRRSHRLLPVHGLLHSWSWWYAAAS